MSVITDNFTFAGYTGHIVESTYTQSGNPAWQMFHEEHGPIATITVNVPGLAPDELAIKDYSENEGVLERLMAHELVELPHRFVISGFALIPVVRKKAQGMGKVDGLSV
jgi:hypothetical protein